MLDKFPANNVWSDSQRRRSSLRNFPHIDSDSDEQLMAPTKPTARVIPAIYQKESSGSGSSTIGGGGCSSRVNRDSSCDSAPNDTDYGGSLLAASGGAKSGNTSAAHLHHHSGNVTKAEDSPPKLVVGIPVQDRRKTETLRKLFSRPQEGGGKGGGKGKGGKGKCGVIVMESETERKMLQRSSMSPASSSTGATTPGSMHRLSDRLADIPRDSLTSTASSSPSPLQRSPRVGAAGAKSGSSRRQQEHRLPEMESPNAIATPTTPSTSVDPPIALPKLTYDEQGRPTLMCKIDLSRIPYIVAKKRSEEMRIRSDLPDTRQQLQREQQPAPPPPVVDVVPSSTVAPVLELVNVPVIEPLSNGEENDAIDRTGCSSNSGGNVACNGGSAAAASSRARRLTAKKSKTAKRKHHARDESPTSPPPASSPAQIFKSSSSAAHTPSVEPQSDSSSSDSEPRKKCKPQRLLARTANDSMHTMISP